MRVKNLLSDVQLVIAEIEVSLNGTLRSSATLWAVVYSGKGDQGPDYTAEYSGRPASANELGQRDNRLAASAGAALPELETVRYATCWALMLAFSEPLGLYADRIRPHDEVIEWIARNASKPGRAREKETVVVHAGPDWSRQHLDWFPEEAAREIFARFQNITGLSAQAYFSTPHRWRYALVEQAVGRAFLWNEAARLGVCGDWCLGPRVEAAFDSGEALGEAVSQTLEADIVA